MATCTIMRGIYSKTLAGTHQLFRGFRSPSRCLHGIAARALKPDRFSSLSQTAITPLTQFIRRRYSSRDSPPNPANRAPNLKDILQDEYNKFVEASFHDQNGRPKFGDGYKDTEYFKKVNNIHHGIKLVMKDVELMMNNIDRSRKEEMDHLVEKVDEVQKVIALQRSLASGDGERGDGLENAMEEPEDEDGGDDLRDDDKNDDNNKEDDDLEIESDDLKQKLAALENKVDSLRMEFRYFRSQISADFTVKTIEKIFRLMDEKFPRDRCD